MVKRLFIIIILMFIILVSGCSNNKLGWNIDKMNIKKTWKITKGNGEIIAFVDTGICNELAYKYSRRIVNPYNVIENNTKITDKNGHGTEMISAACASGEKKVWGIAPESKIMPICSFDNHGQSTPENLVKGIMWAVDHKASIINLSIGSQQEDINVKNAIDVAISKHILVVAAAGDLCDSTLMFPADMKSVISVKAQNSTGKLISKSSYSNEATISAPGSNISVLSVGSRGSLISKKDTSTSVATAEISGVLALILSVKSQRQTKEFIEKELKKSVKNNFIDVYSIVSNLQKK